MDDNNESLNVSMGTANMIGIVLSTMTFGVHLAIFSDLNRLYFCRMGRRRQWRPRRHDWKLLAYVYILLLLSTTGLCLQTWANHDVFVIHRTYPGGPLAYLAHQARHPIHATVASMYVFVNCFADGMLLHRAYVLSEYHKYVATACILSFMALVGTGGYFVHSIAVDGIKLWTSCKLTSCIIYLTLSFGINFVFTAGIVCRLFYNRREFGGVLGSEVGRVYTSIAAMLIESASLHTVVSLLAIIACAGRIPFQGALMPMLGQLHAISPIMVVYRVASGRAVARESWSQPDTIRTELTRSFSFSLSPNFRKPPTKISTDFDASSFTRLTPIHLSPLDDNNRKSIRPVSERSDLRLLSTRDDGENGDGRDLPYEDNDCSPSANLAFLPPGPQTPSIALMPLNSTTKNLSRPQ